MKRSFLVAPLSALAVFCASWQALSQTTQTEPLVRPRTVAAANAQQTASKVAPSVPAIPTGTQVTKPAPEAALPAAGTSATAPPLFLTPAVIQTRIAEAKRLFKTRPQQTAMTSPSIQFVNIAALD